MAEEETYQSPTLRQRAEAALRGQPVDLKKLSPQETEALIHELQVHQIELEMQNEELQQAQQTLAEARDRYADLYDFAPVGYFTISEQGLILAVNLAGASLVGVERRALLNQPFSGVVARESQDRYYLYRRRVFETRMRQTCELDLLKKGGSSFFAQLESIAGEEKTGEAGHFRMAVMDISERKALALAHLRQRQRLEILHELDKATLAAYPLESIAQTALESIQTLVSYNRASVVLFDLEDQQATLLAARTVGESNLWQGSSQQPLSTFKTIEALQRGEVRLVEDMLTLSKPSAIEQILRSEGIRSYLSIPLIAQDELFGALNLGWHQAGSFASEHIEIGQEVAEQLAIAIRQARLSEQVRRHTAELQQLVAEKTTELRDERNFISAVLDTAGAILLVVDTQGRIVRVNRAGKLLTGYSYDELYGKRFWDLLLLSEEAEPVKAVFEQLRAGQFPNEYENHILTKTGDSRLIAWSNTVLLDAEGMVEYIIGTGLDITIRKATEVALQDSERRYRQLLEAVTDYIYSVRIEEGRAAVTTHSPGCEAVTGYSSAEYETDPNLWYEMIYEADRDSVNARIDRVLAGEDVLPFEHRIVHKNGTLRWLRNTWVPRYDKAGDLIAYEGLISDVTARKRAEELLAEERNLLRALLDNLPQFVYVKDAESRFIMANQALADAIGNRSIEALIGKTDFDFFPQDLAGVFYADEQEIIRSGQSLINKEEIYLDSAGDRRWILTTKVALPDDQSRINRLVGIGRDITELKHVQEAYQMLVEHSLQGLAILQGLRVIFANPALAEISGYTVDEIKSFSPDEVQTLVHPEDRNRVWQRAQDRLAGKSTETHFEFRFIRKDGQVRWLETFVSHIEYQGQPTLQVAVIDTTARKRAEEALYESEKRFRTLFETAAVGIAITGGRQGNLIECNPAFQKMLGYTEHELHQMTILDVIAPDDYDKSTSAFEELRTGRRDHVLREIRYRRKDGRDIWGFASVVAMRDSNGDWLHNYAIVQDITQRKVAEEALLYQANLLQNASEAIIATDLDLRITSWNKAAEKIYGWQEHEVIGQNIDVVYKTEFLDETQDNTQNRLLDKRQWLGELRQKRRNGETIYVRASVSLLHDSNGNPIGGVTVNRDITKRKHMEEALKTHGRVLDSMAEGVLVADEADIIYFTNPAFDAMFGYKLGELRGQHASVLNLDPARTAARFTTEIIPVLRSAGVWFGEFNNRKKDGSPFITAVRISRLEMPDKTFLINVQEDITERKRLELEKTQLYEEASEQRAQLRALAGRLVETQEAERKVIARELHDQMGQNLTALDLNLNIIQGVIAESSPQVDASIQTHLDDSLVLVEHMGARIRDIMADLRPSVLDDFGLLAALRWYTSQLAHRTDFTVVIQADEDLPRLPAPVELALFRIVQEALTNVARHAQAGLVTISLDSANGTVRLVIADDGLGFAFEDSKNLTDQQSWGLITMAERAEAVGGQCRVESRLGQGTQVTVEVKHPWRGEA